MNLIKSFFVLVFLMFVSVSYAKLKLLAFKGPHHGFIGLKYRKPKLLGLKHHGLGGFGHGGFGHGGFGGGAFHSSGYQHHEYHQSHYSGGGGGGFGGWLGK